MSAIDIVVQKVSDMTLAVFNPSTWFSTVASLLAE